jgi:hypothetical protein
MVAEDFLSLTMLYVVSIRVLFIWITSTTNINSCANLFFSNLCLVKAQSCNIVCVLR